MNYYRRFLGDYLKDTSRLSLVEHGAYTLMLDYYYADEQPLPLDHTEICRMIRAFTPEERKAVEKILARYFVRTDEGYRNGRADDELGIASAVISTARENGKLGGRPKKTREETPGLSGDETGRLTGDETGEETGMETRGKPANNHPPTPNHHPPSASPQPPTATQGNPVALASGGAAPKLKRETAKSGTVFDAYSGAYERRYGVAPVRNAKVNSQLVQLVDRLGGEEAPAIAAFYVRHNSVLYVRGKHPVDLLVRDAEGLRTEWATGNRVTDTQARQADRTQANGDVFGKLISERERQS